MLELIASFLKISTDVPYNIWAWLLFLAAPALVFTVRPEKKVWLRLGFLILAIGLTYVLINLTLHTHRTLLRKAYDTCQSQFSDGFVQHHEECGEINIADGASNAFYAFFGWIPAMGYVGFCEFLWRTCHRKKIKEMGKQYKGRWFSNVLILTFIPVGYFIGYTIFFWAYDMILKGH